MGDFAGPSSGAGYQRAQTATASGVKAFGGSGPAYGMANKYRPTTGGGMLSSKKGIADDDDVDDILDNMA